MNPMDHAMPTPLKEMSGVTGSRRRALTLLLGVWNWEGRLAAGATPAPVRLAISQNVVGDVNLNDARAAMQVWVKQMTRDLNLAIDLKPLASTQEIVESTRKGQLDAVALNIIEYRQIADLLDSSQIVTDGGAEGLEQYLIVAKRNSGIRQFADLKGRRLNALTTPRMCVAQAWLLTLLEEGHYGSAEQFFGSVSADSKYSRVVLPVFFGQADACLTSKQGFDMMCELNPQVARELIVVVGSPPLVVEFYIFRKGYQSVYRQRVIQALFNLSTSPAGQQLATLFHFDRLTVRDASSLASVLSLLERAERAHGRPGARSGK
jgi:ABC-type phosphate/phosphonate transport system substrate-binding protein